MPKIKESTKHKIVMDNVKQDVKPANGIVFKFLIGVHGVGFT